MDSSKMAKLLDYAKLLAKEGEKAEKEENGEEAIPKYIKAVDILLLLAEAAPTYPDWTYFIQKAEFYQKRAKIVLAKASLKRQKTSDQPGKTVAELPSIESKS
jgi:hypothetical protein